MIRVGALVVLRGDVLDRLPEHAPIRARRDQVGEVTHYFGAHSESVFDDEILVRWPDGGESLLSVGLFERAPAGVA